MGYASRKLRDDAKSFKGLELDADLALGIRPEVEQQARTNGFLLIANQAATVRR